jgi:hypothetical protein
MAIFNPSVKEYLLSIPLVGISIIVPFHGPLEQTFLTVESVLFTT